MRSRARTGAAALIAACLIGALMVPGPATPQVVLPEITLEQVLEIAQVDAPPEDIGLKMHADFPTDAPLVLDDIEFYSITADILPDGSVIVSNANAAENSTGDDAVGECSDPAFMPLGPSWSAGAMPLRWKLNENSIPDSLNIWRTRKAIRRAHYTWHHNDPPFVRTNCDDSGASDFRFKYAGAGSRRAKYDGVNIVDFGSLGGGALAVAYTWYKGTSIIETDLRFNAHDFNWSNNWKNRNAYQVINVATHELGHHLGLDDLNDPHGGLTMFGRIGKGERSKVSLGKGDVKGATTVSP